MAKSPREIANERQDREQAALHHAIGYFIFWFSQLEFTIKARLAGALQLDEDLFDIIIGPYDFAMLCTVTEQTLMRGASAEVKKAIKKYFDQCRALNQQARIIVAHGSWTYAGARHVSRNTLKANRYFAKPEELRKQADIARRLMALMMVLEQPPEKKS